jgi:hypothetical protein
MKDNTKIKAIETIYNGYRFRSRLEARWAVFFDALGIKYEYEKEGFELENGEWYLPDFWLPEYRVWAEIKGETPSEQEIYKMREVTEKTVSNGSFLGIGLPGDCFGINKDSNFNNHILECKVCGKFAIIEKVLIVNKITKQWRIEYRGLCPCKHNPKDFKENSKIVKNAFLAAKQARFEHGEKPMVVRFPKKRRKRRHDIG